MERQPLGALGRRITAHAKETLGSAVNANTAFAADTVTIQVWGGSHQDSAFAALAKAGGTGSAHTNRSADANGDSLLVATDTIPDSPP